MWGLLSNGFGESSLIEDCPTGIEFINSIINKDKSGELPISFIPNHGQFDDKVDFTAHKGNRSYWFTSNEIVFDRIMDGSVSLEVVRLNFIGSNESEAKGLNKLGGQNNYIKGNDKSTWKTGIPNFQGVVYENIYDGIDAVFSSSSGFLKSDFIVNPNADVNDLRLSYSGADDININAKGELVLKTKHGEFVDGTPIAYQIINNNTEHVKAEYSLSEKGTVSFDVEGYDSDYPLIIDPFIKWSSFMGGDGWDDGMTIEYGTDGSIYAIGTTDDHEFPHISTGSYQENHGGPSPEVQFGYDIFVSKISSDGSSVEWCTFIGGNGQDIVYESTIDASNNIYIIGETNSTDFPFSSGAYQTSFGGGSNDAFLVELSSNGTTLNYGTYLGGSLEDRAYGITLGSSGDVYISGETTSTNFPIVTGGYQTVKAGSWDAFVSHINPVGGGSSDLQHSTYLGGSNIDLARTILRRNSGEIVLNGITQSSNFPTAGNPFDISHNGGNDIFVAEFSSALSVLSYGTFIGGSGNDYGHGLAETSTGDIIISGYTASTGFPTTTGAFDESFNGSHDAIISKISMSGSGADDLLYSTFIGGSGLEWSSFDGIGTSGIKMNNIAVGCGDMIYLNIGTESTDLLTTADAYDRTFNTGTGGDRAIIKLSANGSGNSDLLYSTYLGSTHRDENDAIILNPNDESVAVTAGVMGWDFPTTVGAFQETHGNDGLGVYQKDVVITTLNFIDYGDAPDSYGTYRASNGPRHILGDLRLGSSWDAESNGTPNSNAEGDDNLADAINDEDGIQLDLQYLANTQGSITATISGGSGWLAGWFDWNRNDVFDNPSERAVWQVVVEGNNVINFNVPVDAAQGTSFARFRLAKTSTEIENPTSSSNTCDGEVEDYEVSIVAAEIDFGDLPNIPYKTLLVNDGARHYQDGLTYLGTPASPPPDTDYELDGQPNSSATGDDDDGFDDENGVTFLTPIIPGQAAQIQVTAGVAGYLNAWIDYNSDGDFNDTGENIASDLLLNPGNNQLLIEAVPLDATGPIKSRFRFTSGAGQANLPYGSASNGEVEDYSLASIGDYVWEDIYNGKQNIFEEGLNDVVVFLLDSGFNPIAVTSSQNHPSTGEKGWYEFPGLPPGDYYLQFNLLGGYFYTIKDAGSDDTIDSDVDEITGRTDLISLSVGELENTIDAGMRQIDNVDFGDLPEVYQTYISNEGPAHVINGTIYLGNNSPDAEVNGQPNATATGDDLEGISDEDGVTFVHPLHPGASADIEVISSSGSAYLNAWIDFNNNSDFSDIGEQIADDLLLSAGNNIVNINSVPITATGPMYSRFRISTEQGLYWYGAAPDGEVEDYVLGSIGNYAWADINDDGIQNEGNGSGLNDVQINLLDESNNPILDENNIAITATTKNHPQLGHPGYYEFPGLPPGDYIIEAVAPATYTFTDQDMGGDDNLDSDVDVITGKSSVITVSTGIVNQTIDIGFLPSGCTTTVTSTNDNGPGSLRDAMLCADFTPGVDIIDFDISGAPPYNIYPTSALPEITEPVTIDGSTEPDYIDKPIIVIDGTGAGSNANGITITAGNSTVRGLVINNFNDSGIKLINNGSNTIAGNYIGVDYSGSVGNVGNYNNGIYIFESPSNIIGGITPADRNIISGNRLRGIWIDDNSDGPSSTSQGNQIRGNYIGINANGNDKIPYKTEGSPVYQQIGVSIWDGVNNVVGGVTSTHRNIISGNSWHGVYIWGSNGNNNTVQYNYIGTDNTGLISVGNCFDGTDRAGVFLHNSVNNIIGGGASELGNVIAGNFGNGIIINGSGCTENLVASNKIGIDKTGIAALPNSNNGIIIKGGASGNTIGGNTSPYRNIISGNSESGIILEDSDTNLNEILGNYIGTSMNGTAALPNGTHGVHIIDAGYNTIGEIATGSGNKIANNLGRGIAITGPTTAKENSILRNEIYNNSNVGIDLAMDGVTLNDINDADGGENDKLNFPVISDTYQDGSDLDIYIDLDVPINKYLAEFFDNPSGADGTNYGEGEVFIGGVVVYQTSTGNQSHIVTIPGVTPTGAITSTLTIDNDDGTYGATSEFSEAYIDPDVYDYGDLPDGPYNTYLINNGAEHLRTAASNIHLGALVDSENDGQPNSTATGDDVAGSADDDGIQFINPLHPGRNAEIRVNIPTADKTGYLNAWADFNNDGDFQDTGERIANESSVSTGVTPIIVAVPSSATGLVYNRFRVTLNSGEATQEFGVASSGEVEDYALGSISNFVWNDVNSNGIQDGGELGIENVTLKLLNGSGAAILDADSDPITTLTDANGLYEFPGLPSGDYIVEVVKPSGYSISMQNLGANDDTDSDANIITGRSSTISITAGLLVTNVDFGLFVDTDYDHIPDTVEGSGDRDGDGVINSEDYDPSGYIYNEVNGEIILGGQINVSGPGLITIVEDGSKGYYEFYTDGTAGTYTLELLGPTGYDISTNCPSHDPPAMDPTGGPNPTFLGYGEDGSTGYLIDYTCANNQYYLTFDIEPGDPFVFTNNIPLVPQAGSSIIGNFVWNDKNHNEIQDDGVDSGIANVTIELVEAGVDETFDTADDIDYPTQVTDANGVYQFVTLPTGKYRVTVDEISLLAEDGSLIYQSIDYDGIITPHVAVVVLGVSEMNNDLDFGYRDSPLSVNLIEFTANLSSDGVHLNWATESEVENQGFVIERREESSQQWREIANYINNSELLGHGTVTDQNEYEYLDQFVQPGHTYEYRLGDVDYNAKTTYHNSLVIAIEVTDIVAIPEKFELKPAYPNPFNPITNIQYALPNDSKVRLSIYDISGTLVATLVNRREKAGNRQVYWNGRDSFGNNVSGGIYLYRIEAGQFVATRKMLLLR